MDYYLDVIIVGDPDLINNAGFNNLHLMISRHLETKHNLKFKNICINSFFSPNSCATYTIQFDTARFNDIVNALDIFFNNLGRKKGVQIITHISNYVFHKKSNKIPKTHIFFYELEEPKEIISVYVKSEKREVDKSEKTSSLALWKNIILSNFRLNKNARHVINTLEDNNF